MRKMDYFKFEISVSNVENIVGQLSGDWRGNEYWLNEFVLKLNDRNKTLRDDLRENNNFWTYHQYKTRLAYHYYEISALFNTLYMKHKLDVQSIIGWLKTCLGLLEEIPSNHITAKVAKLTADAEEYLAKSIRIQEALKAKRAKLKTRKGEDYVSLCAALGDILGNTTLHTWLKACTTDERERWLRKLQNLVITRVVAFLEDSFTNRNHKNPLVTSNLLLSLGCTYETVGIPFLGERYRKTGQELLKSVLESSSTTKDRKQNMKNIITESIKDGNSLKHVYLTIEETYTQPLSVIDQAYISRKYNIICFKQYIEETVEYLKDQASGNKDRQTIHAILTNLRCSDTLLQILHPLDQSIRYKLMKDNYSSIDKEDEQKWMNILKKESFAVLIDFVIATKKELHFLEALVNFLGLIKDTTYLENKLNVHQVCTHDVPLSEIINRVLNLDVEEFGEELREVQAAAAPLKDEESLFYEDKFRDFIIDYFKPPKIRMVKLDGRNVLEVTGLKIVLSNITREETFKEILSDTSCEEVRIIAGKSVHVDGSFSGSKWSGKNIVVITNRIRVHDMYVWDVSGRDSTQVYTSDAGRLSDGTGEQGKDGDAGESGGNVLVLADTILNSQNLAIRSLGGNGSKGQDGGDGKDGQDGKGITKPEFEAKFPPVSKFKLLLRFKNLKKTLESMQELGTITYKWYERPVSDVSRWVPFATLYKHVLKSDSHCFEKNFDNIIKDLDYSIKNMMDDHNSFNGNIFAQAVTHEGNELEFSFQRGRDSVMCQSYFLFKGAPGKPGTKGGAPGLGGQGGFGGEVVLRNPHDPTMSFGVEIKAHPGADGQNGKGGKYGSHGKTGCDMGYLDYTVSELFNSKWPKWYGEGENSKVELTYHESYSSESVWVPFLRYKNNVRKYVGMSSLGLDNHKSRQFDERMTLKQNQERRSNAKATKKKTISQANILSQYQHLLGSSETASLQNLFDQIEKTNEELLQSIAHTRTSRCEVSTKAEFTRSTAFRKKTKSKGFQDCSESKLGSKRNLKPRLIEDLKFKPMPVVAWAALGAMQLTKDELTSLVTSFDSLYATSTNESAKIQTIREMFLEKYRFLTLNAISKILSHNGFTVVTESIDAVKVVKYLQVEEEHVNPMSHWDLGTLNQFLYINKEQEREKLVHYIKNSLKDFETDLPNVFRSFVLALGNSSSSSDALKSCFNDYNRYREKKERGLVVFEESLSRIDHKHSQNKQIIKDIKEYIQNEGCLTSPCIQLLAHIYNVNIRIYKESSSPYEPFYLEESYNPIVGQRWNRDQVVHVLIQSEKCTHLQVHWEYIKLDKHREMLGTQCTNILRYVNKLNTWASLEKYLVEQEFFNKSYCDDFEDEEDSASACQRKAEKVTVLNEILKKFDDLDDQALLGTRLSKISNYVPGNVIESIHKKFSFEGRSVSVQELCCLINAVLKSAAEGNTYYGIYQWLISAYPQDQWIDQLLLMDIETHFRKSLPRVLKKKWEGYLSKIKNKNILMQLREKLETCKTDSNIEKCVGEIFYMLSEIPGEFQPGELGLAEWPCALKEKYWTHKLTEIREWKDAIELSAHSYYLLSIENNHGDQLVKDLVELITSRKDQVTPELLTTILTSFYNETWDLSKKELEMLETSTDITSWVCSVKKKFLVDGKERDLRRLCELVESNANTSDAVKILLPAMKNHLDMITMNRGINSYNLAKAENDSKAINDYNESDIARWLKAFSGAFKNAENDINEVKSNVDDIRIEMLGVVNRAISLKRGFRLRDTQMLAVMILMKNRNSTLAQVATGEGKSLIVVALSIIEALVGGKVDIITSSSVLAKRDAENNQDLYNMFGINVSHNCSEDIEVRKTSYSGNQVVYGDLSDFQRDYLLHEFYNINILGDRKFETVVVDEVDSMLLDKGNNMLYLSHNIQGLDKLESLYLFIWRWISSPCGNREDILHSMNAKSIRDAVIYDLYGTIRIEDIKALNVEMNDSQARAIWEKMKKNNTIDEMSRLKIEKLERDTIEKMLSPNLSQYTDRLCYLINECIFRDRQIHVPNCLKPFVDIHLDKWISNAINAFFMKNGEDYVVDVDRTGSSPDRNPNITILDKDTGTDQSNSQWDEALHQFLQLKHGCKVSMLSLKAVFISNVTYFKQYDHLYGLTGTLGSQGERKLLKEVHNVDFVTIPTAKPKQFQEYLPKICYSDAEWKNSVRTAALDFINKKDRSVLIICHSVNDVENLHLVFGGKGASNVHTYARDYEEFEIAQSKQELGPGHIVIATNLAGRGTDIKISDELKRAGGLHVIVAYLPKNTRIEQQAFGRAARCGEKGSGQLIILITDRKESKILNLKNERDNDELERISEIKSFYENQIKMEEMCFGKFKERFIELKNSIMEANSRTSLSQSAVKLATAETLTDKIDAVKSVGESALNAGKSALGMDTSVVPKKVEDILLKSCINKWAFWLDENGKFIKDLTVRTTVPLSQKSLQSSLDKFLSQMKSLKFEDQKDWSEWLDGNPVSMVELAKHFRQNKSHDLALALLDKVIDSEPYFSESAHYYKAATLGAKIDWESNPSDSDGNVKNMKSELLCAEKLFERFSSNAMANAAIIGKMKHENQQSLIQVDAYEEQQKNIANLCRFFAVSISDILGHSVTPESFCSWNIKDPEANTLYRFFIQSGILTQPRVTLENISETDVATISCEYDISSTVLTNFLHEHNGKEIVSFKQFKNDLKHKIRLPSKEAFWKELVKMKILLKEVKYVIVKHEKLAEVDPSLLDTFNGNGCNTGMKQYNLEQLRNQIILNSEQMKEQTTNTYIFEKEDFIKRVGRKRYAALKEKAVLAFNRRCDFLLDSLKSAANSHPKNFKAEDLVAITDESERESVIEELSRRNVISPLEYSEGFTVLMNAAAIDELPVVNEKVKDILKKYSGDPDFQLAHYDSISDSDLIRNRVTQNDAQSILHELEQIKIIEKIPRTNSYRLTTHYTNIDGIRLKTPVYENVTKSVINMCFSYRTALQKMVSHLDEGDSARLHLKTKPHVDLFWSLYDYKVISPSQVSVGVSKEEVEKVISTMDEGKLGNMMESSGCVSEYEVEDLIRNLIKNNWMVCLSSSTWKVEKDKGKRKPLDRSYSDCQKTIAKMIDELANLSDETSIATINQSLDRMKSTLKALDVPSFGLKPLSEALSGGDFSMIQELSGFMLGGLGELIVLEEKAYTFKFWVNVGCVVLLGICQIVIGAIIDVYSVGAMTYVGNAFISEGISDIMFAIGAMRTGYFSWKDYGRHKIESVALTIVSAGVGAYWSKGTKLSRVGQKMNPTGLKFGAKKLTEETGAAVLKTAGESITKEVLKTVALKTTEAVFFAGANALIDTAITNNLQSLGKSIASQILTDIDQEVQNHKITASLERAFRMKGESNARIMLQQLTEQYFTKTTEWQTLCSWATKIFSSVIKGVTEAAAKKQGAGLPTSKTDTVLQVITKATVWVKYATHIIEILNMTKRMLDELAKEIDSKLANEQSASVEFDETRFARFKTDIVDGWRDEIRKRSGVIIEQQIISPLMKDGAHMLLRYAGRKVKDFYRQFKDKRYYQELLSRKKQYQDEIESVGDDVEARERITKEYCDTLLKLAAKTRDPKVYAEIIDEDVELDITCLHPLVAVLPEIMRSQGNEDGIKIVVEKGDVNQTLEVQGTSGETSTIRLRIIDNHFELLDDDGQVVPLSSEGGAQSSNNCLIRALAQRVNLGMTDKEVRNVIVDQIKNNPHIQNIIKQGYHRYGILLGLHGGRAHPYERPGYWEFDPKKDIDLLTYKNDENGNKIHVDDEMSNKELNEHLKKAYNEILKKINLIVTGKSQIEGWENVKLHKSPPLRPEDFEPTMYDTVYTTGEFGTVGRVYYPVEMETIVEVKKGQNVLKYSVEIDIDALTRDQKGPQGPHIGYSIKQYRPIGEDNIPRGEGPKKVVGHCAISTTGNDKVPRRALMSENEPGVVYVQGRKYENVPQHQQPEDIPRLRHTRLFYGFYRIGSRLQREGDGTGSTRGRTFPSREF